MTTDGRLNEKEKIMKLENIGFIHWKIIAL